MQTLFKSISDFSDTWEIYKNIVGQFQPERDCVCEIREEIRN